MPQERIAIRLLLLVCILVFNCAAQPLARLVRLDQALSYQMLPIPSSGAQADDVQGATPQPSSCQLNGKWLSAASLLSIEQIFFAFAFVIALLAPLSRRSPTFPLPKNISSPKRRLHLTLCVWRE